MQGFLYSRIWKVDASMMKEIKGKYREQQLVTDIGSQLRRKLTENENEHCETMQGPQEQLGVKRLRVFTALFTFATHDEIEERAPRSEAINAVTALCRLQRPRVKRVCRGKQVTSEPAVEEIARSGAKNC